MATPSAAELATRLGIPILAVINGASMANSFGAIAFGLKHYRPGTPVKRRLRQLRRQRLPR